jgi:hypothetical protein
MSQAAHFNNLALSDVFIDSAASEWFSSAPGDTFRTIELWGSPETLRLMPALTA